MDESPDMKRIADILKQAPPKNLPNDFAQRVVATALKQQQQPGWRDMLRTWWAAFFSPRPIVMRPAWQVAWAFVLCLMSATATGWFLQQGARPENVWVRFAVKAPSAQQVALAGDFNAWQPGAIQMEDPDGDGLWHVVVPLRPGIYQYMFVLNGEQWIADPQGGETIDDGFGQQNSLLKINHAQFSKKATRHAL